MNFWFDLKYSLRLLRKDWGYALMCVCVVALSVGLALWAYALAYSQVLKPLGFPDSQLWYSVQIASDATSSAQPSVDAYTYQELVKRSPSAEVLGSFASRSVVLSEGEASVRVRAASISPHLLAATAAEPQLGRLFDASDSEAGATPAIILSFAAWQHYFAANPDIIGAQTRIDSQLVRVVGVLPEDYFAFEDFEVLAPLQLPTLAQPADSGVMLSSFIVVRDSGLLEGQERDMNDVVSSVNSDYPDLFNGERHLQLIPAHLMYTHSRMQVVTMLSLLALAVLVLGAVNVSMVFLARLLERTRELALRSALGASRGRLVRQCLLETASTMLVGLVVGCGLAALGVQWAAGLTLSGAEIEGTGRAGNILGLRPVDVLVAVAAAIAIWLLSTLLPALRVSRQDAAMVLAGTGKGTSASGGGRGGSILVGVQVIIASLVLVICGNLVFAVNEEARRPGGVDSAQIVVSTYPTEFDERYAEPSARLRYWEDLSTAIAGRIPGAETAYMSDIPTRPSSVPVAIEGREGTAQQGVLKVPLSTVSDGYFSLLGITLRTGRLFDSTDNQDSLRVGVIDELTARRYWPNEDAIGKRLQLNPGDNGPWLTIVGVVSHTRRPYDDDVGLVYQSLRQAPGSFLLMARIPPGNGDGRVALRGAAFAVDHELPLHNLQWLGEFLTAKNQIVTSLIPVLIAIGCITSVLAATGLLGLISRSVAQRTQEVGIRRALGATPWQAISMFMRQGAIYMGIGLFGIVLGIVLTNLMGSSFSNILDHVVVVTIGVVVLTGTVIFSASYLPTRHAVALEPGDALRYE